MTLATKLVQLYQSSDKYQSLPILSSIITSMFILGLFLINYPNLPTKLPLFYSLSWGEVQLVPKAEFIVLPLISTLLTFLNIFISYQLHSSQYILKRILTLNLSLINLLLVITALKILSIFI